MVSDWKEVQLGDVSSDVSYGYTESATNEEVGPKFLRITDIQNGVVNWNTVPYCPIEDSKLKKYLLHKGDIVVARTGNSTGENYIFTGEQNTVYASYLIRFRIKEDVANPFFVWYSMRSPHWWAFIQGAKTGSAQAGANAKVLSSYSLKLPPIPEQKAIAHILGTLDDKIELNRQMNETLEAMAQALFKSWFVDFDPVIDNALLAGNAIPEPLKERAELRQAQLDSGKTKINSEINDLFPSEFEFTEELGWIPKGWEAKSTTEVAEFQNGYAFYKTGYSKSGYKVVDLANIHTDGRFVETHRDKFVSSDVYNLPKHEKHQLHKNDIVMAMTDMTQAMGILGKCGKIYESNKYILNQRIGRIRVKKDINVNFLMTYLNSSYQLNFLKMRALGTVQKYVNTTHIKEMKFVIPNVKVMNRFGDFVDPQFNKMREADEESETLAKIRDTLLPKLMSGELRIADAEKLVADI